MQDQTTALLSQLQPHLSGWHLARQKFLVRFMLALLKAKTVNLTHIAPLLSGVEVSSDYRRIQRFFQEFPLEFGLIARLIWALLPHPPPTDWV
jgi:hypothetical protein